MADSMVERYVASMVLSGSGDALGFKNGGWEFCKSGKKIHADLEALGGIEKVHVKLPGWRVSDDTVMHLATAEALASKSNESDVDKLYIEIASNYKDCMNDMGGRSPGDTCMNISGYNHKDKTARPVVPFASWGGGCGAAMRAMCIGLRYFSPEDLDKLIAVSVESGRMTHHHPTGYNGALAAALFVSYAIQGKPVKEWGAGLMSVLPKALKYVEDEGRYVDDNKNAWSYFVDHWKAYLKQRGIADGVSEPTFPPAEEYGIEGRDAFYTSLSYDGWGGASGHDAPMIAYDALLSAGDSWSELCSRGMFHCGDSDSTGVIAAACYGAMYGFTGVPTLNYMNLEYRDRLAKVGEQLYMLSHPHQWYQFPEPEKYVENSTDPNMKDAAASKNTEK